MYIFLILLDYYFFFLKTARTARFPVSALPQLRAGRPAGGGGGGGGEEDDEEDEEDEEDAIL